jgi:hypothetical protein
VKSVTLGNHFLEELEPIGSPDNADKSIASVYNLVIAVVDWAIEPLTRTPAV